MSVKLTDEEIKESVFDVTMSRDESIALEAQKRLAKWGDELCEEHSMPQFRRQCGICWQALCKELGVK